MILSLKFARRSRPRSISNSRLLHTPMLLLLLVLPLQLQLLVPLLVLLDLTQLSSQPELPSVMLMQRLTHNCCLEDNLLVLPDMLLVLSQLLLLQLLLLLLPQQLLLLQETANRRLTDSAEVPQSSHPEPLLCQNVSVFHTVLLSQSVLQSQKPSLSPTVLLCQNALLFQDRNAPQSPELSQTPSVLPSQSPPVTPSPDQFHRLSATPSQSPSAELSHSQSPWLFHVSSVHQSPEKSAIQSRDRLPGKSALSTRPRPTTVMAMPLSSSLLLSQLLLLPSLLLSALLLLNNTVMEAPTTHMEIPTPLSLFPELTKNTIGSHTNNQYLSKAKLNFNQSNLLKLLILPTFST